MATYRGTSSKKTGTTGAPTEHTFRQKIISRSTAGSALSGKVMPGGEIGEIDVLDMLMGPHVDGPPRRLKVTWARDGLRLPQSRPVKLSFANVYKAAPQERIGVVKSGVAPSMVGEIATALSTTAGFVIGLLGLKRSTIARKQADADAKLSPEDSEKLVGLARLAGQVEVMVKESGDLSGFDPGKWLTDWLNEPIGALGGQKPAQYMDTNEGQAVVSSLLLQIQHGVYA